jgi:regulator of sirC expression with transglutaminase-like and TPR domain
VAFLGSNEGRYRVRALRHLAGGNHRLYILLSEFLTRDSLDDLVSAFEQLAEELTPYFQERIRSLSPQQARIVQSLCNADGALTVKALAETTFIPERSCSKQLGELKQKCYVKTERRGKESYYEMAEPLMRLCLEVKNQRGRPLRLIAMFLRAWFPLDTLQTVKQASALETRGDQYRAYAIKLGNGFEKEIRQELEREIQNRLDSKRFGEAMAMAGELVCTDRVRGLFKKAEIEHLAGDHEAALSTLTDLIGLADTPADVRARALVNRGLTYGQEGQVELELADYTAAVKMPNAPAEQRARALIIRGLTHRQQGHVELEIADYTAVVEMPDAPADQRARALGSRGSAYHQQGRTELTLADFTAVVEMPDAPAEVRAMALDSRGTTHWEREDYERSRADYIALIGNTDFPATARRRAAFFLPEAMIPLASRTDAMAALSRAFDEGDPAAEYYGGTPHDVLKVVLRKGHREWADYVSDLVPIYQSHGAGAKLGNGLTRAIAFLDEGDFSPTQLDAWNDAWQEAGRGIDELEIALRSLDCAVRAIKTGSDRPLFELPLEIRELVAPLLRRKGQAVDR